MMQLQVILGRMLIVSLLSTCLAPVALADSFHYLPEVGTVELYPQIRIEPLSASLYKVHVDQLAMYLQNVLIFDTTDDYENLPYIVGFDNSLNMAAEGAIAYTEGLSIKNDVAEFSLLTAGRILKHPISGEQLGVEAFVIGTAVVQKFGEPQTVLITNSLMDMQINTRLVPLVGIDLPSILEVKYPSKPMSGYILAMEGDRFGGGNFTPVVISLGRRDGLKKGNVLNILEESRTVLDRNARKSVTFPIDKIGEVLVYKVGEKISLAIITYSDRLILPKYVVGVTQHDLDA
ncbi:MAG TPA: hypothetical protein VLG38_03840 [Gammaproteobacteria bacterium]|nr:hypothetical protein [Gammaproteobacteria bacterium]